MGTILSIMKEGEEQDNPTLFEIMKEDPNMTYKEGLCPIAESIQPKLIQLKTNFESIKIAKEQALILSETIDEISGS